MSPPPPLTLLLPLLLLLLPAPGARALGDACSEGHEFNLTVRGSRNATGHPVVQADLDQPAGRDPWRFNVEVKAVTCPSTGARSQLTVTLTDALNGEILTEQSNCSTTNSSFISTACIVKHTICFPEEDQIIVSHASRVLTYWFVDCIYYGVSTDFSFQHSYSEGTFYNVEALVVAHFNESESVSNAENSTELDAWMKTLNWDEVFKNNASLKAENIQKGANETNSMTLQASTKRVDDHKINHPHACLNSSFIPSLPNKTFGYFQRNVSARAPITDVQMDGDNWIESGEILHLQIECKGSPLFYYCAKIKPGIHNITGNESCATTSVSDTCTFMVRHYFREVSTYTIVFIISNDISKVVRKSIITMYTVKKEQQLSVVLVPISFSLIAVLIIVFGVAYYIESKKRFIIEIADFSFGRENEVEYKTFCERLREEFCNLFNQPNDLIFRAGVFLRRNEHENFA